MKKLYFSLWAVLLLNLAGCDKTVESSVGTQAPTSPDAHFVLVQLPADPVVEGSTVTLNMNGQDPQAQVLKADGSQNPEDYQLRFEVGEQIRPGTLTVTYPSGERRTMSQLVFDTPITAPEPAELTNTDS